jgi:hypothetical protein
VLPRSLLAAYPLSLISHRLQDIVLIGIDIVCHVDF